MAYDSAREKTRARPLHGTIEPDRYYLLYGDGTEQRFEAASQSKLYLKIERRQFVALFGDFDTGFTVTELTRYNRSLSGFRADYAGEALRCQASRPRTRALRPRRARRATARRACITCRARPSSRAATSCASKCATAYPREVVVETRELSRFIDYDLDYERARCSSRSRCRAATQKLNPGLHRRRLRSATGGEADGGRRARGGKFAGDKLEIGASAVSRGRAAGDTRLMGTDLTLAPDRRERAARRSRAVAVGRSAARPDASAWLVEGKHVSEHLEARAWARETGSGFGVGQQLTADTGTRSAGVDARYKLTERWAARGEATSRRTRRAAPTACSSAPKRAARPTMRPQRRRPARGRRQPRAATSASDQAFVRQRRFWDGLVTLRALHGAARSGQGRERRLPGAHGARRRLSPLERDHAVRRIRTRRGRADRPTRRASACARRRGSARR